MASLVLWLGLLGGTEMPAPNGTWLIGGRLQVATLAPRSVDSRRFEVVVKERLGRLHAQACIFADVKDSQWNGSCFPLQTGKLGADFVVNLAAEAEMPAYDSQAQRLLRALISDGNAALHPQRAVIGYDLAAPLEIAGERAPASPPMASKR